MPNAGTTSELHIEEKRTYLLLKAKIGGLFIREMYKIEGSDHCMVVACVELDNVIGSPFQSQ